MIKKILKKITPVFLLSWYHYCLAFLGAVIYGFPSRRLIVIGITGTSGKSTTVDFTARILEGAGKNVASISSLRFKISQKEWKNELKMTTPGRFKIQKFLRQAVNEGCRYAVLEIASEGIKQHRHRFITFDAAVFTNLSPEHLEAHNGFENYRNEKLKLFIATKNLHVINADDVNAKYFLHIPAKEKYLFGITNNFADLRAQHIISKNGSLNFSLADTPFSLNLLGNFNVYNALAAISVGLYYGASLQDCKTALEKVSVVPGRMEIVHREPLVVVDYAHTPEQLEKAYQSLAGKNLICVLGSCGGGRDKWKRPVLGKMAGQYCREVIITNEDPYDEDPLEIMQQVAEGVGQKPHSIVLDRKEAIKKALELAKPNETVIITGKGAEPLMCLADGKKIPWDDRQIVKDVLNGTK